MKDRIVDCISKDCYLYNPQLTDPYCKHCLKKHPERGIFIIAGEIHSVLKVNKKC